MSSFTSNPVLETVPGSKEKIVVKPFRYYVIEKHYGPYITVPYFQHTDGGSIPWIIQPLVGSPWDSCALAAYIVHDRNYRNVGWNVITVGSLNLMLNNYSIKYPIDYVKYLGNGLAAVQFSRKACDRMLYDGCKILNKPTKKAYIIYKGVRLFGGYTWFKHSKKNKSPLFVLK